LRELLDHLLAKMLQFIDRMHAMSPETDEY
jgi:hypothetical protein